MRINATAEAAGRLRGDRSWSSCIPSSRYRSEPGPREQSPYTESPLTSPGLLAKATSSDIRDISVLGVERHRAGIGGRALGINGGLWRACTIEKPSSIASFIVDRLAVARFLSKNWFRRMEYQRKRFTT